jgi:hypothetical protein
MDDPLIQLTRLFSLLLGLGIAAILNGLALAWRIKWGVQATAAKIRIGALVPLLGLLVIFDQTSFVIASAELFRHMSLSYASLLAVLVVIGGYFAISTFVFPDDPAQWPSFDDYYLGVSRLVVSGMIAINLSTLAYELFLARAGVQLPANGGAGGSGMGFGDPVSLAAELIFFPLLGALLFVRSKKGALALLVACNFLMLFDAVYPLVTGKARASELRSDFDDISRLFALLIGLAISVLIAGLARCWRLSRPAIRRRHHARIGWLVPLLGMVILLNQASFFIKAFEINRHVPFSYSSLLAVLSLIGGYYVISTFVFPPEPGEWPDYDAYYGKVKRPVIGGMVIINAAIGVYMLALVARGIGLAQAGRSHPHGGVLEAGIELLLLSVLGALFFTKSKPASISLLCGALALLFADAARSIA